MAKLYDSALFKLSETILAWFDIFADYGKFVNLCGTGECETERNYVAHRFKKDFWKFYFVEKWMNFQVEFYTSFHKLSNNV